MRCVQFDFYLFDYFVIYDELNMIILTLEYCDYKHLSKTNMNMFGANHLISTGGTAFTSKLINLLYSATNQIIFSHTSHNLFIFFLHFVHISMGQIVNNLLTENQNYFIFFQKKTTFPPWV